MKVQIINFHKNAAISHDSLCDIEEKKTANDNDVIQNKCSKHMKIRQYLGIMMLRKEK